MIHQNGKKKDESAREETYLRKRRGSYEETNSKDFLRLRVYRLSSLLKKLRR